MEVFRFKDFKKNHEPYETSTSFENVPDVLLPTEDRGAARFIQAAPLFCETAAITSFAHWIR